MIEKYQLILFTKIYNNSWVTQHFKPKRKWWECLLQKYDRTYFIKVIFILILISCQSGFIFSSYQGETSSISYSANRKKKKKHEVTNCSINRIDQLLWSFCRTHVFPPGGFGLLGLQILQGLVGVSGFSLCRYLCVHVIRPSVVCRPRGNLGVHVASLLCWTPCRPLRRLVQRVGPQHLHLVALLLWPAQPQCVSGFLEGVGVTGEPLQWSGWVRWRWSEGGRTEPVGVLLLLLLLLVVESGQRFAPALHLCQLGVCDAWWTQITWVAFVGAVEGVRHQPCVLSVWIGVDFSRMWCRVRQRATEGEAQRKASLWDWR